MDILQGLNAEQNQTFVIVTHDQGIAARTERIIHMQDGQIVSDEPVADRDSASAARVQ
jgi:lipoprotein-releasing system ATP-binding protein